MIEILVVDVETTGTDENAAVCQAGWTNVLVQGDSADFHGPHQQFLHPGRPIPPEASAIHHITNPMVANAPDAKTYLEYLCATKRGVIFCAHNAAFEKLFLGTPETRWLCTMKAARRVWPTAPSHGNQALRYWLELPIDAELASPAHHAGPDSYVTAIMLIELLKHASLEDMIQWSGQPSLLSKLHFGKHAELPIRDVPTDYWQWVIKQDFDEDVMFTARSELQRRGCA